MKNPSKNWSKKELKVYLLLLCAQTDSQQSHEEIDLIRRKTDSDTFDKIYQEFEKDVDEDTRIQKIESAVHKHEFSQMELADLKKEIHQLFHSDKNFSESEKYLDRILDNIVY